MEDRIKINDVWYVRENSQKKRPYMLGDTFSLNFDYEGMLDYGLSIDENTRISYLELLLTSFEDVNYHREAEPLYNMIQYKKQLIEIGNKMEETVLSKINKKLLVRYMKEFKKECEDTLKNIVNSILRNEDNV